MHNRKMIYGIIAAVCVAVACVLYYVTKDKEPDNVEISTPDNTAEVVSGDISDNSVSNKVYVYVCGCVNNPGVVCLDEGSRVVDVINLAGGMTAEADGNAVNQAELVSDGQKIYIPSVDEEYSVEDGHKGKININTAGVEQLTTLPGIGESRALAIISYREQNGRFNSIEDIMKISGIKTSAFNKIKDYICT